MSLTEKEKLFYKARDKNLFWSYRKDIRFSEVHEDIFIETVLKYGDYDDLLKLFEIYSERKMKEIWINYVLFDDRFKKLNNYLAKVFFECDLEETKRNNRDKTRLARIKALAAENKYGF